MEKILVRKLESLCSTTALTGLQQALYDYSVFTSFAAGLFFVSGAVPTPSLLITKSIFGVGVPGVSGTAASPNITVPPLFISPSTGTNYWLGP